MGKSIEVVAVSLLLLAAHPLTVIGVCEGLARLHRFAKRPDWEQLRPDYPQLTRGGGEIGALWALGMYASALAASGSRYRRIAEGFTISELWVVPVFVLLFGAFVLVIILRYIYIRDHDPKETATPIIANYLIAFVLMGIFLWLALPSH